MDFLQVSIDCPYEYLVSFSGRYGPYESIVTTVKYLMLETNVRSYSFGYLHEDDTNFSIPVKSGEFVGFHRRCSRLLDSVGLHLTPCSTTPAEASGSTAIARARPYVSNGPWGGQGGGQWSYEFVGQLNRIIIDHGTRIRSIMFEDSSGISEIFGALAAKLQREFVVGLRGSYGKLGASGPVVVKYLVIQTNLRTHGPFGTLNRDDRNEVEFTTPMVTSGRVVGFHIRCGLDLDSIGLLVMP
ncbi:Mannose/glucose-specific lectin [Morella rubra]|uniref:Mannose/glucose-specific lectin n=1 Tax=Morella rubra TaxID=262757 RepID=A0A6A1W653_9ROSI|nr:Mannose/glucose-specific lectin [Morella rubra]